VLAAPVVHGPGGSPPEAALDRFEVEGFQAAPDGAWVSDAIAVTDVVMVGATIAGDAPVDVRAHDGDGWGPWLTFPAVHDHGPDHDGHDHDEGAHDHDGHDHDDGAHDHDGHDDEAHEHDHGSEPAHASEHEGGNLDPLWVGPAEQLQIRVHGERPERVSLDTVAMPPEKMRANQPTTPGRGAALASPGGPEIIPRDAWDPDGECRPTRPPESGEVRMAHVHHTVMYPTYEPQEADDVVRALCLFHVEARGFGDLGYNFMIDAYGRIYAGRAGGIDRAVVGSHAAGFNHVSAGISVMGDHETDPVSDETVRALEGLLTWLFTTHGVNPLGTTVVESTGGAAPGLTDYAEGELVELPTIVGHRDTATDNLCPGRYLYEALEDVPTRVADRVAAAAQRVDRADEPGEEPPGHEDATGVAPAGAPAAAPAPRLPVTGWGGLALALLTLGIALIVSERRSRSPTTDRSSPDSCAPG
jgi:hypothetical protein